MICPKCRHTETQVIDSRDCTDGVRRRRECLACKQRFTTYERSEAPAVVVTKKGGDRERFDKDKIKRGVALACKNRPVTTFQIDALAQEIEQRVYLAAEDEISSKEIGLLVQELLQQLDGIAYLRFASVYQSFDTLQEFEKEIHNIH